jgi:hypothetical protein
MQVIDLKRNSRIKAGSIIDREYGGRSNFRQAVKKGGIGIGSLRYIGGIDAVDQQKDQDKFYKANIEFYNNGMGMYIYNVDENYLVLIGQDEIDLFRIFKPLDVIKPANFSFFSKMSDMGMDYYKCRFMLLEHEIVEHHPVSFHLHLKDGTEATTYIKKRTPYKHCRFFGNNALGIPYKEEIHGHLVLDE